MKQEVITINDKNRVEKVMIDTTRGYISFVGEVYERGMYTEEQVRERVQETVEMVYGIEYFVNNRDTTFEDLIEEWMNDDDSIFDAIGDVIAYKEHEVDGETLLETFELTSVGQFSDSGADLTPYWDELHGKKDTTIPQGLLHTLVKIMTEVSQVPMWEQEDMEW